MFTQIGNLLSSFPKKSGTTGALRAIVVRRAFDEALIDVCSEIPKQKLSQVKAHSFKEGVLIVNCSSIMAGEMSMRARDLIRGINEKLNRKVVFKLVFKRG